MSEKKDQEYFADGMAEEIQNILAKLPQLRVLGRAFSFQFKGSTEDVRTVASKLGAAYVVSGRVSKAGSRIRVTAQLIDAKSGAQLWSERFDREFNNILVLQDEIATAIARALRVTVSARDARALGEAREAEAYTLCLKGKLALDSFDTNSLAEAQSNFEQALVLNPKLVAAAEGMAQMWRWRVVDSDITPLEAIEQARLAAEKVLSMDSRSSVAHEVLGFVAASRDFDWAMADTEIQKALALNPNDPEILEVHAEILLPRGRIWPYGIAVVFAYRGETNDAFEWLEKAYVLRDYDLQSFVRGDPLLMSLHGDVRWAALLKKMHLSPEG
jgi:adenylate cyclase